MATPPTLLQPDAVLAARFTIESCIGRGGFGEVYSAYDALLDERIAIKLLRPALLGDAEAVARFRREVQMARRVGHPAVCRLHDLFDAPLPSTDAQDEPVRFVTMQLIEGITLYDHLCTHGALPLDDVRAIARALADGLDAAHEAGVIHRDLKSRNILLPARDDSLVLPRAIITDFGLARPMRPGPGHPITQPGQVIGSPAYLAPEQICGDPPTAATDQYAFGILLYEMTTGTRPFVGPTPHQVARLRLDGPPPPPSHRRPDLPPAWEPAILRCLHLDPAQRFASVGAAAAALCAADAANRADAAQRGAGDDRPTARAAGGRWRRLRARLRRWLAPDQPRNAIHSDDSVDSSITPTSTRSA